MDVVHAWREIFGEAAHMGKTIYGEEDGRACLLGCGGGKLLPKSLVDWPGDVRIARTELGEAAE